jgi:hypothetical protein
MAFTNNENSKERTSNTFGFQSKNNRTRTALAIRYFSKTAEIAIRLPKDASTNPVQFDYKSGIEAYIGSKDCKKIAKRGRKALEKLEQTGEFEGFAIGLSHGLIQVIQVRELKETLTASLQDVNPDSIAVVIYTDVDDQKKTDKYLVHVFNPDIYIKNYNPATGSYTHDAENVEFELFLDALEDYAIGMTNGRVHAAKEEGMFDRKIWEGRLVQLASSLGVDFSQSSNGNRSGGRQSTSWGNADAGNANRYAGNRDANKYSAEIIHTSESEVNDLIAAMQQ